MWPLPKKCIVQGCKNQGNQGEFKKNLCSPCYHALSTGDFTNPTTACWGEFAKQKQELEIRGIMLLTIETHLKRAEECIQQGLRPNT